MKDGIRLIGRGQRGWHVSGKSAPNCSFSGSGGTIEGYLSEAPEGCPVYDASEADAASFISFVVSGPMVNHDLASGQVSRWMAPRETREDFGAVTEDLTGLDYVAVDVYLALLRAKVPGVKIGKVSGVGIAWEGK